MGCYLDLQMPAAFATKLEEVLAAQAQQFRVSRPCLFWAGFLLMHTSSRFLLLPEACVWFASFWPLSWCVLRVGAADNCNSYCIHVLHMLTGLHVGAPRCPAQCSTPAFKPHANQPTWPATAYSACWEHSPCYTCPKPIVASQCRRRTFRDAGFHQQGQQQWHSSY
jgi:hypothetical protein